MGNEWDRFVPPPAVWDECLRVLKPGGYMAVFAGARTADLMGLSIRLAGFEIRDTITWMYGNGFPKSLDVGKAIDKAAGAVREVVGIHHRHGGGSPNSSSMSGPLGTGSQLPLTTPATKEAKKWEGWGTALKPAGEPIIVARKPFVGTIAANVLKHGTGGMNIDGCRVPTSTADALAMERANTPGSHRMKKGSSPIGTFARSSSSGALDTTAGRWPANVVLSHGEDCEVESCVAGCPVAELDQQSGPTGSWSPKGRATYTDTGKGSSFMMPITEKTHYGDYGGGASRFFNAFRYQAKAPKSERPVVNGVAHPTVKPLALMEWLVTLFTPLYGVVLDPFTGSGTTGHAALKLGFSSILIERDAQYWPLIDKRFGDYLGSLKAEVG
jgi:site-specific DNA-methyltransferase (adenine-specific)